MYVEAPLAESETELPEQIVVVDDDAVTVGVVFTVISCVAVDEQPLVVPVTVYVVVDPGETVTDVPVNDPGIQLYVVAPDAVRVVEDPLQTVTVVAETLTVGVGVTVISCVVEAVQPFAAVPVTVYVVVEEGVTVTAVPVNDPGIQLYVDAPFAVIVVGPPSQMAAGAAEVVTVGDVFTVISCVAVAVHPFAAVPVTVYVVVDAGETLTVEPLSDPGIQL